MTFKEQQTCEQALDSLVYKLKFDSFKVTGQCVKKS